MSFGIDRGLSKESQITQTVINCDNNHPFFHESLGIVSRAARLHTLADDLVRGDSNRLQSRGAKPVYGRARDRSGKAGQHGGSAGDVVTLRTVWLCASQHNVVYFGRVKLWHLAQDVLDAMCCQIFGAGSVERTAGRIRPPR